MTSTLPIFFSQEPWNLLHPSLMSLRFTQKIMKNQQKNIDLCQSYIWLQNNKGDPRYVLELRSVCYRTKRTYRLKTLGHRNTPHSRLIRTRAV